MTSHILIAFDDSDNAMRAVDFVGTHVSPCCSITLFTVLPDSESLCAMQSPELIPYFIEQQSAFCTLEEKKKELLMAAQQKARNCLVNYGFNEHLITIKSNKHEKGIARDIIDEANGGLYDLIVLGKKGQSAIKEFFLGSVSQKVLNSVKKASVLLVD
ncbi:MAG: universal stress protein [Desulfosalsimonadaceae bacterium]